MNNSNEVLIQLGKRIAYLRSKNGLTQERLAELVGRSTNHISKLELARCNPSFELLVSIAYALGIGIQELFTFEKNIPFIDIKKEFREILNSGNEKKLTLLYKIYSQLD